MSWAFCTSMVRHSKVKFDDIHSKRWLIVLNPEREQIFRTRFDGCVVDGQLAADWVAVKGESVLIIELKGKDLGHGAKQAFATAEWLKSNGKLKDSVGAIVLGTQVPRISTVLQRHMQEFRAGYSGRLQFASRSLEQSFEQLVS